MTEVAYFAAGCYWNSELIYAQQKGVVETEVGWATFPSDRSKGDVEVVKVIYDTGITSYGQLVDIFWSTHNPSNPINADDKFVERSVLLFTNPNQESVAISKLNKKNHQKKVYTKVAKFETYTVAPENDQKYYFDKISN